ncbi:MAG: DUF3108 domain-containing protein, partial [Verrucomicrobiota bacterium]|nr:DUF3108 domain-containing protein [Verrucomicrobiota bacterium]
MIPTALFLFTLSTAVAADWRSNLSNLEPGSFPAPRAATMTYDFGWATFRAAEATATFSQPNDRHQVDLSTRTVGFVRTLWRMDAKGVSSVHRDTLLPVSVRQQEFYRGKTTTTELDFTPQSVAKFRRSLPDDKTPPPRKKFEFPRLLEMYSAYLFVRSQELTNGQTFRFVAYPSTAPYLATIAVAGHETLRTRVGERRAIKLDVKLQKINRAWGLEPHAKFKRAS